MKTKARMMPPYMTEPGPVRTEHRVLGFTWRSDERHWFGQPLMLFRPSGLILWGELAGATLELCLIGHHHEVLASSAPVPARFFALGQSYAEVVRLIEKEGIEPPGWATFSTLEVGQAISLVIQRDGRSLGPKDGIELCVWGIAAL